jgi:tetratricopeptide (TPR) repeat protein
MRQKILIAHAEGEDSVAEELAEPLRREGYDVIHRGTVLVGDSMTAEASKALNEGAPVVLCATVRAIGTVWARNIVRAAQPFKGVRVFPVRMERDAAVYDVVPDGTMVAEYWQSKEQALSNLVKALHAHFPAQPPESGVHERVLRDYLTIVQCKYATLPDAYRADKFRRLTDIYIPQYLEPQDESQDLATQASPPSRPEIAGAMAVAATARVTFHQALGTGDRHLLVVGGPGTGKSSFLRHLAHEQATLWLEGKSVTQLPILISAASFCENLDRPLSALLHAACTREFGAEWQNTPLPPSIFDMPPAREGRWLVYVDGLDTIADTASLERLLAAVRNRDPKGAFRFILTSRPIPKLGVRSSGPIAVYRILPFDDERLSAFASAWYKDQPETARNFIQELARARLGTLGQIPLLATVAATLIEHHRSGVFRGRSGMYEDFVQHILREKKDQQPSAQEWLRRLETSWSNLLGPNASQLINDIFIARRALLEFVAARRREHPHETLVDACIIFIGDLLADEARLKKWLERSMPVLRDDLLPSFLIESGLVTERGGAHAFLHDTFEEYLAAASIARKHEPHDQPSLAFMARWHDPRWREILLFLLGKWSERGNDLSDLLSSVGRTTPAVSFIGTAIAEGVVVSPAFGAAIEETLLQLSRITSNAAVANGLRGLARRPSVRERLATLASDATVSPDKRISLCQLLVAIGERGPARDALRAIASTRFLPPIERGMAIASMNELSEDEASALLLEAYETLETGFEKGFLLWASGGVKVPKSDLARVQRELLQTDLGVRFFFFEVYRTRWGRDSQEEEVVRSYVNSPTATASERVRGWVELFELGRTTEAADAIATLVDDPALDVHAIASAAKTLHKTGHSAKALDVLRRHIADTSVDPSRRLTLAATLGELGHLEEAQPTLRALMDSSPKDEQPFEAADALQRLGVQDIESWFVQLAADPNVSPSARLRAARRIGDPRQLEAAAGYIREVWQHADATWPDLLTAATALGELASSTSARHSSERF